MRAKVGETNIAMFLNVTLDGQLLKTVTEADEAAGYVVRYRMENDRVICDGGGQIESETVHGAVAISLAPFAPEWAQGEYARRRAAESTP